MKKLFKKVISAAVAASMAFALSACGGSSGAASAPSQAPDGGTDSGAATAEAEGSPAPAASGATIKIGGSGPLTGPAAVYGNAVKAAAELAVEEVNAKGGLQFELRFEDDAHDAEKAVTAYGVLKDWGMQASLATVTSAPGAAVSQMYQDDSIFAISPSGSSLAVIYADPDNSANPYGNVFQMCFTDPNQGIASADYLAAHTDIGSKIAIIYKNDDNYSTGIYTKFKSEADAKGLEVVYEGTFDDSNAQDFSVQLGKAQSAGADIVYLPIYYDPASLILTQANQMGYKPVFFGVDGMDGILTLEGFDTSLAEGVYLLTPFSADASDDLTKNFVENYKARMNGEIPNQFAADAYDCIYSLHQAAEAAGVTADMSSADICEALKGQFTSMTFNGLTGQNVTWSESGEVSKSPKAVIIKDGAYVGVED
ncbi:MAG: ABC transporter substrate-binding protein [Lachnospiraceae bacterium]|nr:ABC transporter substrate-binding protein [Lachnospiraceae bacterium]